MPSPEINLETVKPQLRRWFETNNLSYEQICALFEHKYHQQLNLKTLKRRFATWGWSRRVRTVDSAELRARIKLLIFHYNLNDAKTFEILKKEGHQLEHRAFVKIRKKLGIYRRINGNIVQQEEHLRQIIQEAVDSAEVEDYGIGMLATHFRTNGILCARFVVEARLLLLP